MNKKILEYKIKKLLSFEDGLVTHDFKILEIKPNTIELEETYTNEGATFTDNIIYYKSNPIQPYFAEKNKKDEWLEFYNTLYKLIKTYERRDKEI